MSIKSLASALDKIKSQSIEDVISQDGQDRFYSLSEEVNKNYDLAKDIILKTIAEEELVKYLNIVQTLTVNTMVLNGEGEILSLELSGILDTYTHTVVLAVIGGLIADEVL